MLQAFKIIAGGALATALSLPAWADGHTDEFTGAKGYVGEKGYVGDVVAPQPRAQISHTTTHRKRVRHAQQFTVPGCPSDFTGMFRGTLYCVNGRPMP